MAVKRTKLVRGWRYGVALASVNVKFEDGTNIDLVRGGMAKRFDQISRNERNIIIAHVEAQIDSFEPGDCPPVYRHMLYELKYGKPPE